MGFFARIYNFQGAQFELSLDWQKSHFVSDIFVVDANENCQSVDQDAQPLFTYDWDGLKAYYSSSYDGRPTFASSEGSGK